MTLIEFFEKNALDNICSSLVKAPERVVLLGDKLSIMQKYAQKYKAVLHDRGADVEFVCRTVNKNKMQTVIDTLSAIVNEYDDCVFDLTGGEDLCLVALGVVFEKYKNKNIQMHKVNVRNNTLVDGDLDGETVMTERPQLSVEENIRIYGGDVVYSGHGKDKTFRWDMNDGFKRDINSIWNVCREDPRLWNAQISVFETAEKISENAGGITAIDDNMVRAITEYIVVNDDGIEIHLKCGAVITKEYVK